jgi:hypothetical protein
MTGIVREDGFLVRPRRPDTVYPQLAQSAFNIFEQRSILVAELVAEQPKS